MRNRNWVNDLIAKGRAEAEALMGDTVTIERPTGRLVTDPTTGVTRPETTVVYVGCCKLQTAGGIASQVVSAAGDSTNVGGNVPVWSLYLHVPYHVHGLQSGDLARIDSSMDEDNIGRRLRLVNLQSEKTHATAHRWNVSEMPKEGDDSDE